MRPAPVLSQSRQHSLASSLVVSTTAPASRAQPIRAASAPSTPRYSAPRPPPEPPMRMSSRPSTQLVAHRPPPAPPSLSQSSVRNQRMSSASQTFEAASMAYGRPRGPSRKSPRASLYAKVPGRTRPAPQRPIPPPPPRWQESSVVQPPWDSRGSPPLQMPLKFWDRNILLDDERDRQRAIARTLNSTVPEYNNVTLELTPDNIDYWRAEFTRYR